MYVQFAVGKLTCESYIPSVLTDVVNKAGPDAFSFVRTLLFKRRREKTIIASGGTQLLLVMEMILSR